MVDRIKGDTLTITIDGEEFSEQATAATIENDDADSGTVTFADAAKGGKRDYTLNFTMVQSLNRDSLWRKAWDNVGRIVPVRYAQLGNTTPTPDQPHYVFDVKIGPRPTLGGEAAIDGDDYTSDAEWKIVGEPVLDDGGNGSAKITTVSPTGKAAGQQVVLTGTRFGTATAVKFGTKSADSIIINSDQSIIAVIPAGVSGAVNVTVVSGAGTSDPFAYTAA